MIWIVYALFKDGQEEVARFTSKRAWQRWLRENECCTLFPDRAGIFFSEERSEPSQRHPVLIDYPVDLPPSDIDLNELPF